MTSVKESENIVFEKEVEAGLFLPDCPFLDLEFNGVQLGRRFGDWWHFKDRHHYVFDLNFDFILTFFISVFLDVEVEVKSVLFLIELNILLLFGSQILNQVVLDEEGVLVCEEIEEIILHA